MTPIYKLHIPIHQRSGNKIGRINWIHSADVHAWMHAGQLLFMVNTGILAVALSDYNI